MLFRVLKYYKISLSTSIAFYNNNSCLLCLDTERDINFFFKNCGGLKWYIIINKLNLLKIATIVHWTKSKFTVASSNKSFFSLLSTHCSASIDNSFDEGGDVMSRYDVIILRRLALKGIFVVGSQIPSEKRLLQNHFYKLIN